MCGICGIMSLGSPGSPIRHSLIARMTDTLTHRGPDDCGTWQDAQIALGHRRLSVIDLSRAGRQPMGNEDGSVQITYNGEVYNFQELKQRFKLVERGHVFRSQTDTEVLVHLYEELGIDMVTELNGMFAMAIWDARRQTLHLIRDRYGIKPLFYHQDSGFFRFGSEIKAIIEDDRVPRQPSLQALHDFLTFDYIPGQQTAFEGIYEVPPAHWMSIDTQGHVRTQRYWDLQFKTDESIDEPTAVEHAMELMKRSVNRRLIADVPIGVLLSGGMDSSTLVALMHQQSSERIRTYSIGFEEESFNELPAARLVSQTFGTVHREITITPERVRDMLPKYLSYIDEPYGDGSAIPTYYVCGLAKDEVVVLLSGEGGDETFAGYETYSAHYMSKWFQHVPRWVRRSLISPLVHRLPTSDKKLSLEFKMKRFLGGQDLPPAEAHLWWRVVLTEHQKEKLYTSEMLGRFSPEPSVRHFRDTVARSNATETLDQLLHIDSSVFLPDDLMIKNDRMSMAHSLEARVPMTDPELVEFMAKVPPRIKFRRLRKKHIMRLAMAEHLPSAIINKKKVGLEMPYSRWLRHELNDLMMDYLGPKHLKDTGLFQPAAVQQLVDEHMQACYDHGRALWGLLNYMMWFEMYIA